MQEPLRVTDLGSHEDAAAVARLPPCMLVKPWRTRPAAAGNLLFFTHIWGAKISLDCAVKALEAACCQTIPLSANQSIHF